MTNTPIHLAGKKDITRDDRDSRLMELEEQNKSLATRNYINDLGEDKLFRLELLQALERINGSINNLAEKFLETTGE